MGNPFVPLHVHSCYSFLSSTLTLGDLVQAAAGYGFPCMALTDSNGLYGSMFFANACLEAGIRPIWGSVLEQRGQRITALVRDAEGFRNLCRAITRLKQEQNLDVVGALTGREKGLVLLSGRVDLLLELRGRSDALFVEIAPRNNWYQLLRCADSHGLHALWSPTIRLHGRQDRALLVTLQAIKHNTTCDRVAETPLVREADSLADAVRLARELVEPRLAANSLAIAKECAFAHPRQPVFPRLPGPPAYPRLRRRVMDRVPVKYPRAGRRVYDRIERELAVIRAKGFADYFLVVARIVKKRRIYCGRGSAAASIVAYLLDITDVDPLAHNLFFERFLHEQRRDPPDIDVDFPWDERDDVLEEIFQDFGRTHTAMVANHVTLARRMALREVAKVHGLPEWAIKQVTRTISYMDRDKPLDIASGRMADIARIADRVHRFPRHLSVHCGGVIITPEPIADYVPVETAAKGVPIIQWEKDQAEDAGLIKIDILGNRSLAVIRDALDNIRGQTGQDMDYAGMAVTGDRPTRDMFAAGDSLGVFYLESPAMRLLQQRVGEGAFADLVVHSSIIRPAANRFINDYVKRRRGQPYRSLHPVLARVLAETFEIMVYQEDVSKVAMALCGFTISEADELRRVLAKKHKHKRVASFKGLFFQRGRARGVDPEVLDAVWGMIESFSGYSFCKPHSASYVMVSYKSGFLKRHFPAYFWAAAIENRGGYYRSDTYIYQARRQGLTVRRPAVNACRARTRAADNRTIQLGWSLIKGLKQETLQAVETELRQGAFSGFDDFFRRLGARLDDTQVVLLIKAGVFDRVEKQNPLEIMLRYLSRRARGSVRAGALSSSWTPFKAWLLDVECYGFSLERHPAALLGPMTGRAYNRAVELQGLRGRAVELLGHYVTAKPTRTAKGRKMLFLTCEDPSGLFEGVLFPDTYERCRDLLYDASCFVVRGRVARRGPPVVEITDISPVVAAAQRSIQAGRALVVCSL